MWASGIVGPHTDENAERRGEVAKIVEDLVVLADEVLQREAREGMQSCKKHTSLLVPTFYARSGSRRPRRSLKFDLGGGHAMSTPFRMVCVWSAVVCTRTLLTAHTT